MLRSNPPVSIRKFRMLKMIRGGVMTRQTTLQFT
jgi:hypothetical protein